MYLKEAFALLSILVFTFGLDLDISTGDVDHILPNMQEGLLPPNEKIWRGSTIAAALEESDWYGTDPNLFEEMYDVPLQIYRTFRANSNPKITKEAQWIRDGGILFYSI